MLGRSNADKLRALRDERAALEKRLQQIAERLRDIQAARKQLRGRLDALAALQTLTRYVDIDWQSSARAVARLQGEHQRLQAASSILEELGAQLEAAHEQFAQTERALDAAHGERGGILGKQENAQGLLQDAQASAAEMPLTDAQRQQLDTWRQQALGAHQLSVESCDNREQELRKWPQEQIEAGDKRTARLTEKIIDAMRGHREEFKAETVEVDTSLAALADYERMLAGLRRDDLPRFEARFKELLNVNTINEIANFNAQLARERETIKERIDRINQSLAAIDYNAGRFIKLIAQTSPDAEIRGFQQALRACTEGTLTGSEDEQYSEAKFLQVKAIIDRFRGREGLAEADRRWTDKVTDMRNGFLFSTSERWRADDTEYEHYADSGGKSGGQKEKLAYTVLAASLAYQFGLEWGAVRSRSFRFVVIDEAFGRGSDESAQYGLSLFAQLNLQLLIVTPLQKIHIIEPFVASVGFVHNENGQNSQLRCLTIEEYRQEKANVNAR